MIIYLILISAAIVTAVLAILGRAIHKIGMLDGYGKACDDILRDMEKLENMTKVRILETRTAPAKEEDAWVTIK